jgi:hypothetical protein
MTLSPTGAPRCIAPLLTTAAENSVITLANFAYFAIAKFRDDARSDPRTRAGAHEASLSKEIIR